MADSNQRLMQARKAAGYLDATSAAKAMHIPSPTYLGHENGSRGLARAGSRYATFFRVSLDWLIQGKGEMKKGASPIPIAGTVGAGAVIYPVDGDTPLDEVEFPGRRKVVGLNVRGDSQYPRYLDGETLLYDADPLPPERLLNRYAVVITADGRRLVKVIAKATTPGYWKLTSHNAPDEDDVDIEEAYAVCGTLT